MLLKTTSKLSNHHYFVDDTQNFSPDQLVRVIIVIVFTRTLELPSSLDLTKFLFELFPLSLQMARSIGNARSLPREFVRVSTSNVLTRLVPSMRQLFTQKKVTLLRTF